jgi:hypothetical protein
MESPSHSEDERTLQEFNEIKALLQAVSGKSITSDPAVVLAALTTEVRLIATSVEKITETLYGNSKPGLLTVSRMNSQRIDSFEKAIWIVVGVISSLMIGSVFYLVLSHGIIP